MERDGRIYLEKGGWVPEEDLQLFYILFIGVQSPYDNIKITFTPLFFSLRFRKRNPLFLLTDGCWETERKIPGN